MHRFTTHVFAIAISASPETVWSALTAQGSRSVYGIDVVSTWAGGAPVRVGPAGKTSVSGRVHYAAEPEKLAPGTDA